MRDIVGNRAFRTLVLAGLGWAANDTGSHALAQTAKAADAGPGLIEELVVTANKRAENVQTVPISVTVINNAALERATIRSFDDLVNISPSLTITKTTQPANNVIQLRGVGTYSFSIAAESSVAVVIDEIPQAIQAAAFTDLVGIQQVEVLRGPQSTLFGKSASAGVINITTKSAADHFTTSGEVMITDDNERRGNISVSGPLTDTIKFRLTASASDYEGSMYDLTYRKYYDGGREKTVRGRLEWAPSETWQVTFLPHWDDTKSTCCATGAYTFLSPNLKYANLPALPVGTVEAGVPIGPANVTIREDVPPQGFSRDWGLPLKINYNWLGHTITSITSYDHYHMRDQQDQDGTDINFAATKGGTPGETAGSFYTGTFNVKAITQEFRLTSPGAERLRYVAGVWYENIDAAAEFNRLNRATQTTVGSGPANYYDDAGSTSYAVFGQATYDLIGGLSVIGGIRGNKEDINYLFHDYIANKIYTGANSQTAWTGRGGLQYKFNDQVMAYLSFASGYKGETYDLSSSFSPTVQSQQPVKAETSENWELGVKSTLFGNRMILDATLFNTTFYNYQLQSRDPVTNLFELVNVGVLRTRGLELDSYINLVPNLSLDVSGVYDNAYFATYPNAQCYSNQTAAQGCVNSLQTLSGKPLNNAPAWSLSAHAVYDIPLDNLPVDAFLLAGYRYKSHVIFLSSQDPDSRQSSFGILNLGAGLVDKEGHYKLTFFINNVTNKFYALTQQRDGNWLSGGQVGDAVATKPARDASRYFGVKLAWDY